MTSFEIIPLRSGLAPVRNNPEYWYTNQGLIQALSDQGPDPGKDGPSGRLSLPRSSASLTEVPETPGGVLFPLSSILLFSLPIPSLYPFPSLLLPFHSLPFLSLPFHATGQAD